MTALPNTPTDIEKALLNRVTELEGELAEWKRGSVFGIFRVYTVTPRAPRPKIPNPNRVCEACGGADRVVKAPALTHKEGVLLCTPCLTERHEMALKELRKRIRGDLQ